MLVDEKKNDFLCLIQLTVCFLFVKMNLWVKTVTWKNVVKNVLITSFERLYTDKRNNNEQRFEYEF